MCEACFDYDDGDQWDQGYEDGQQRERERVVEYLRHTAAKLRTDADKKSNPIQVGKLRFAAIGLDYIANDIENGEHP